jgi:UDP-glucuronate 4-epimerase
MNKKVLVTGSAGFIGMHTVLALAKAGFEVTGIDNLNTYYSVDLKLARLREQGIKTNEIEYNKTVEGSENIEFVQLDLADAHYIDDLFRAKDFKYVVHLAAQAGVRYSIENPHAYIDANVKGFLDILESARKYKVEHLVYASSSSVYGLNKEVPFLESHQTENQVSLYAATKKANESMANSYAAVHGLKLSGLRFFTVYGPYGRPDMAPFKFTKAILKGEAIEVYNNGDLSRDFTYVEDIVEGICKIMETPPLDDENGNQIYNIGRGEPVGLMDFIKSVEKACEKKAVLKNMPMQKGDVYQTYASTEKLAKRVGYKPKTDLDEGLKAFVDWYRGFYGEEKV